MSSLVLSAVFLLGLPALLFVVFKTNAAIMFLAACAGIVLLDSLDPSVVATAGAVVPGEGEAYVRLSVVVLAMVFSALLFKNSAHKLSGMLLHGLIILLLALMLLTTLPFSTGVSWMLDAAQESTWQSIDDFKTLIIALGFALSLVVLMKSKLKR